MFWFNIYIKIKQFFSGKHLLPLLIVIGVIYRGGRHDSTLLLVLLIIRGFVFFSSRYFAAIAGIYLIGIIYLSIQGDIAGTEKHVLYFFWYLLITYIIASIESDADEL